MSYLNISLCIRLSLMFQFSRPDRLREIADRFNLDHTAMLDNVLYARAYTSMSILFVILWCLCLLL